ncbi:MAG: FecR domain-containing protein, partial [Spirochaetia bacterium]|nr:FecR domain-containing protein [Spirochaetia bacterium]
MSRFKVLSSLFAGALVVWLASCSKGPINVNVAKVVSVEGTVMIQKAEGSTPIKAFVGSELLPDYVIRTVGEGRAKVQIGERAVISVEPSSSMKVRDLFKDPVTGQENTRVEFTGGKSMVNITKKLSSQDSFDVMTPSAVAGVRGTEFLIDVEDPNGSKIAVTKGSVAVRTRIAALDDSKNDNMPVAVKEALKELAQSQEVPVRVNQEVSVDKKEAEKKNEIINQVVQVATEKMKDVMSKPDAPKESKVEAIQSALSSIVQESQKKIEVSAQNNEFKKNEVAELSAATKAKVESIEVYTPVPIEDLKSLKNKKD